MDTSPGTPRIDALLSHAGWVRGLAGSLVAEPAEADDVAQDAWVAVLQHPPQDSPESESSSAGDENLRGWFASVVRNTVRMRGRSRTRRAEREARVAAERQGITAASSAELVARIETQRLLARKVLALGEPYRSTLILRFYEGLSAAEIARRTGAPAGTVRWRLKRALEELKGELDEDFGGQRAAWMVLVIPLAPRDVALPPSMPAGVPAGVAGFLKGLLAMNLGMKLAALASVAVLAYVLSPAGLDVVALVDSLRPVDDEPLETSFRPLEKGPESDAATVAPSGVRTPLVSQRETSAAAVQPVTGLRGRVVDANARPIVGVGVSFLGFPASQMENQVESQVKSDGAGQFVLPLGARTVGEAESLLLRHPAHADRHFDARAQEGVLVELGDILMLPAGAIEGRILLADGRPAEGAWFQLDRDRGSIRRREMHRYRCDFTAGNHGVAGQADASGFFRIDGVEVGMSHVWAGREGALATRTKPIEVRAGMISSGLEIVLGEVQSTDFIRGQVLLPDGAPAARAHLEYSYEARAGGSGSGSFNADAQGRFLLSAVPTGRRTLRARDRARSLAPVRAEDVQGGDEVLLQLKENQYLALRVQDEQGSELLPEIFGFDPSHTKVLVRNESVRPEAGRHRIPIPDEPFLLEVRADGHEQKTLGPFDGLRAPREAQLVLAALPGLRGIVTAAGIPVDGALVELFSLANDRTEHNGFPVRVDPEPKARGKSAASGAFHLTFREAGDFLVRIQAHGLAATELGPFLLDPAQGKDGLACELRPGGAIVGNVLAHAGTSSAGRIVGASRGDARARTMRCFADGIFRFDNLTPGRWWVGLVEDEILAGRSMTSTDTDGFDESFIEWNCTVFEGQTTRFDLGETPGEEVVVEGALVIDGEPAQGYYAQLAPESKLRLNPTAEVRLGADGSFRLTSDVPGRFRIFLRGDEEVTGLIAAVLDLPLGTTRLDIGFDTGELLVRNVRAFDPADPQMDMILARGEGYFVLFPLIPDAEGNVLLENVPAQRVELRRYSRDALEQRDPLSDGSLLQEVDVPRHGQATLELR